jgi:creatinine amidohydrolase/Fe(II)-dependent formamide hydrolase-like protein
VADLRRVLKAVIGAVSITVATASMAASAAGSSVYLEDLTSPELAARVAHGAKIALVPIGGTEQSGAALVLGKHNARVRVLAGRIAEQLGNAIVAPVIAYVPEGAIQPPTEHMKYPGTISIPDAAFEAMLAGTARSLRQAGFRDVFFLGDHGGYQSSLKHVADQLAREPGRAGAPFHVHALETYYRVTQGAYVDALKQRGYTTAEIGVHAGLADTSLSMALAPEGVRTDALAAASAPQQQPGVNGDPRRSSIALGQIGAALIVEQSVAAIRAAAGKP